MSVADRPDSDMSVANRSDPDMSVAERSDSDLSVADLPKDTVAIFLSRFDRANLSIASQTDCASDAGSSAIICAIPYGCGVNVTRRVCAA